MKKILIICSCYFLLTSLTNKSEPFSKKSNLLFNSPVYDSTYDFNQIGYLKINPKELIGQEIEFAARNVTNFKEPDSYPNLREIKDTFFSCFSTSETIPLNSFLSNTTEPQLYDIVDGSRPPKHYKDFKDITQNATTSAYKPTIIITSHPKYALHSDKAIIVGTGYEKLAGKIFKILDASCIYDYYDSRVAYIYRLSDGEKEINFFYSYNPFLESMIHIRGFIKKEGSRYLKKQMILNEIPEWYGYQGGTLTSDINLNEIYTLNNDSICLTNFKIEKRGIPKFIDLKYFDIPNSFSQVLCYVLETSQKRKMIVPSYRLIEFISH